MRPNKPTWLTLFRIIIIPILISLFYLDYTWAPFICALIFIIAAISDWFDGFLARKLKQITNFGIFLDPVSDKILVTVALILITGYFHVWWITLPTVAIIIREIIILALREWMALIGKKNITSVYWLAKYKTITQMISLFALLWHPDKLIIILGVILLYVATILTFFSMIHYFHVVRSNIFKM